MFPANLENRARYVALGHLHSRCVEKHYKKTRVVYPGSPIALDTKCDKERVFSFVTMNEKQVTVDFIKVEGSPYYLRKELFVFPGSEEKKMVGLTSFLNKLDGTKVMPNVVINGYIAQKDREFEKKIKTIEQSFKEKFLDLNIENKVHAWDTIIENRVVQNFVRKTQNLDDELRSKIHEIVFPIFSDALK
jgi:DNA repair exonuclease SbcCD nuclease subunit